MKKVISIILSVIMLLSVVSITASADTYSGACGENVTWTYNTSTYTLTISGTGAMYDYYYITYSGYYSHSNRPWESYEDSIKKVVVKKGVTKIGKCAFDDFDSLKSVTIPNSVTTIEFSALRDCDSLTSITIPDSVTTIGNYVFYNCDGLTSVKIPDSVITIDNDAFAFCDSLTSVTIGNNVTTIDEYAFGWCSNLTSVTIGDSVETISNNAFIECNSLTEVNIKDISAWCNILFDGYYSNPLYYAETLKLNGKTVTDLIIPDGVEKISNNAFKSCTSLTSVKIPDSVITIGDDAFWWCYKLTSVTIGDGVETIGSDAFYHCDSLTSVTIGKSVTTIGEFAFGWCSNLTSVTIPNSVETIEWGAFNGCNKITDVYYLGTEEEWKSISIDNTDNYNASLLNATIHYHIHEYKSNVTPPTCTEQGYTTHICSCGDCYIDDYVDAIGHVDNDGDGFCDMERLDPTVGCNCNCHKSGISKFFFNFVLFFQKLFGSNKECACGIVHY